MICFNYLRGGSKAERGSIPGAFTWNHYGIKMGRQRETVLIAVCIHVQSLIWSTRVRLPDYPITIVWQARRRAADVTPIDAAIARM